MLLIFFSAAFIFSAIMLIQQVLEYKVGEDIYEDAREVAGIPDMNGISAGIGTSKPEDPDEGQEPAGTVNPAATNGSDSADGYEGEDGTRPVVPAPYEGDPYADALEMTNLNALRAINPDVHSWIYVTDTNISYPVIHYKDNDYYLRRTWDKKSNQAGTIFMECRNSADMNDFNTIIYGHRMKSNKMFGELKFYNKKSYWKAHPNVYIVSDRGVEKYSIYAAYEVSASGMTYRLSFDSDAEKQEYIDFTLENSVINTGIVPTVNDHILTLSTCPANGYETRWVVQAVKRG